MVRSKVICEFSTVQEGGSAPQGPWCLRANCHSRKSRDQQEPPLLKRRTFLEPKNFLARCAPHGVPGVPVL